MIAVNKPGRNEPCPCGSGKKHKHCCGVPKIQLHLPSICACLMKLLSDSAQSDKPEEERGLMEISIPVKMVQSIPSNIQLAIKQEGDQLIMKLVEKQMDKGPELALPRKNIILPGD